MGQFGNQPDFATNSIKATAPSDTIDTTTFLGGSVIYIGDNTTVGSDLKVITTGTVGPSVVSTFSSPGYAGSKGTGYATATAVATTGGNGTGLTVDITASSGSVQTVVVNVAGAGYLSGDLITIAGGGTNAVFRVEATPGLPTVAQAITFTNVVQGEWFSVVVDYVLSDATTVSNLVAGK